MVFNTGAALLDAIVLAVISREKDGTYGYKITQDVRSVLEVSESTLYPVLRRLQKEECLEAYNMEYEALEYYEGYFDDAGPENEGEVIRELGNPGKVAAIIKADLQENSEDYGEYTENGYQDTRVKENGEMPDHYTEVTVYGNGQGEAHRDTGSKENFEDRRKRRAQRGYHAEKKQNKAGIILALIVLVFAAPLIKGLFGGVLGILVTLVLLPFLLTFFAGAGSIILVIGAAACIVVGIAMAVSLPPAGILTIGIGCLMMALGLLLLALTVWFTGKILPVILRKFTGFCSNLLNGRKAEKI